MLVDYSPLSPEQERRVADAMDCASTVHRSLGPGLTERLYRAAYCLELAWRGLEFECGRSVPVRYRHWEIPAHRVDMIVEGQVLVAIKAVPKLRPLHRAQVLSSLKVTGLGVALLINFNTVVLKSGCRQIIL